MITHMDCQDLSHPFDYDGGRKVTERLKDALGVKNLVDIAGVLGFPAPTLSTWHTREFTPMEVCVRVHLAKGVSLKWLLFGEGEMYEGEPQPYAPVQPIVETQSIDESLQLIKVVGIANGEVKELRHIQIDRQLLEDFSEPGADLVALQTPSEFLLIDIAQTTIAKGRYLVSVDGVAEVIKFQRLPGKKLLMEYDDNNIEVNPDQIHSLGKVVGKLERE